MIHPPPSWMLVAFAATACAKSPSPPGPLDEIADAASPSVATSIAGGPTDASEADASPVEESLVLEDLTIGKGPPAKNGDSISIHYVASLADTGKEFDSSRARKEPFDLVLGTGRVIKGWDRGMVGMRRGGLRKVTIPPSLGYGDRGSPPLVPPMATLIYQIELLSLQGKSKK